MLHCEQCKQIKLRYYVKSTVSTFKAFAKTISNIYIQHILIVTFTADVSVQVSVKSQYCVVNLMLEHLKHKCYVHSIRYHI